MIRLLKSFQLDLFAIPIVLNRKGKNKAISRHGVLFTFLFTGFIIWIIYNTSRELFIKKYPNTLNYDTFEEVPAPIILNKETFPFAIGLQLPALQGLNFFKDEEIYRPDFKLITYKLVKGSNGTITKEREVVVLPYETCTLKHFGGSWRSFADLPLESLYCLKPVELELKGVEDFTEVYQILNIAIRKCQNATCKPDQEADEKLSGAWFTMFHLQSAINPQNFTHPNQRFKTSFGSALSPKLFKSAIVKLSHLNVVDDDGWLFEDKSKKGYVKMEMPNEYFDLEPGPGGLLWACAFDVNQVSTTYERKYTKLQTVLAQIQGSATAVILGLIIILHPYSQMKFNETLINELFDVKMKKDEGFKENKNSKKELKKGAKKKKKEDAKDKLEGGDCLNIGTQGLEIKTEALGFSDIMSDRALIPLQDKDTDQHEGEGERLPKPEKEQNLVSVQSFKTLLHSIEDDSESPRRIPHYQKPPQVLNTDPLFDQLQGHSEKKPNKNHLRIEKPGGIKPTALLNVISDSPNSSRKVSEISIQEEKIGDRLSEGEKEKELMENNEMKPIETVIPPLSPQDDFLALDMKDNDDIGHIEEVEEVEQDAEEQSSTYKSSKIDISMWEFFSQFMFIRGNKRTKEKFDVLNKGMKKVRERMDILNIMQKFRELDKLKTLLLEEDQLILFNAIPKAEIKSDGETTMESVTIGAKENDERKSKTFSERIVKKSTFIENKKEQVQIRNAYKKIQMKDKKSKIDARLLEFYHNLLIPGQTNHPSQ